MPKKITELPPARRAGGARKKAAKKKPKIKYTDITKMIEERELGIKNFILVVKKFVAIAEEKKKLEALSTQMEQVQVFSEETEL